MQSLFTTLHAVAWDSPSLIVGLVLVGALLIQTLIAIGRSLLRLYYDRRQQCVALDRLRLQVQESKLRCQVIEQGKLLWNGYRKFTVSKKIRECEDVSSFYLKPHDGKSLPPFKPGQYLTFQLDIPG